MIPTGSMYGRVSIYEYMHIATLLITSYRFPYLIRIGRAQPSTCKNEFDYKRISMPSSRYRKTRLPPKIHRYRRTSETAWWPFK